MEGSAISYMASFDTEAESDAEIIRNLYEQYYFLIYRYALPKVNFDNDAAANCVHAVFDVASKNIEKLRDHENIGGWMMRSLKNIISDHYKAQRRRTKKETLFSRMTLKHDFSFELWPDNIFSDSEIQEIKNGILSLLSDNEKQIYHLFYVENKSVRDISDLLCISEAATKMRLMRLRNKIYDGIKKFF